MQKRSKGLEPLERFNPHVIVSTKNLGHRIQITLKDNGPGIPDAIKNKIFQPFFTTKPTGQGTGLGLSLSYDIVKAHGGELSVRTPLEKVGSSQEKGAMFIVYLPIH
jgi:signal transduction histidine kinase